MTQQLLGPVDLARRIRQMEALLPITGRFEHALAERSIWDKSDQWYSSQKEHWLGWLDEYDGPGAYDREVQEGRSAAFVYNHIVCPPMLIWLAEASGVPRSTVLAAESAALAAKDNLGSKSAAIRRIIPFQMIDERLRRRSVRSDRSKPSPG